MITEKQKNTIKMLFSDLVDCKSERVFVLQKLTGRPVESLDDLTKSEASNIIGHAYPYLSEGDTEVCIVFAHKVSELKREYREKHLGQLRLPL